MYCGGIKELSPPFAIDTYGRQSKRGNSQAEAVSAVSSWGPDSASISEEALRLCAQLNEQLAGQKTRQAGQAALADAETGLQSLEANSPTGGVSHTDKCELALNGKVVDINEKLLEIAREDFGGYVKLIGKLQSGSADQIVEALAEITGSTQQEIREKIAGMSDNEMSKFAASLAKASGAALNVLKAAFEEIKSSQAANGRKQTA